MKYPKSVLVWLVIGLLMVFIQVIVGGITRLTESGLAITKWEVVKGTIPPLNEAKWIEEFELYKSTPQYSEVNEGMSLLDFKFIYFWEFIHRFWARFMGFVFLIPFCWFLWKGYFDIAILKKLGMVVFLAGLAAIFGWIMVASGLVNRPWVNAYKLSMHLLIAFAVYGYLFWTLLFALKLEKDNSNSNNGNLSRLGITFFAVLVLQIFLGGIMAGMKAAVIFPSWPLIGSELLPSVLLQRDEWSLINFESYDTNIFMPSLIHFLHRNCAYLLLIIGLWFCYKLFLFSNGLVSRDRYQIRTTSFMIVLFLFVQVLLGIITLIMSVGHIPVLWGVLHQATALILFTLALYSIFVLRFYK